MKTMILVLFCLFFGCSPRQNDDQLVQLTHEIFDAFNSHEWEKMADYYADSFECWSPDSHLATKAELLEYYRAMHAAFPDIHDEIRHIYPSGTSVVIEFVAKGTAADGTRLELPILGVLTFENGKVVRDVTYYDL